MFWISSVPCFGIVQFLVSEKFSSLFWNSSVPCLGIVQFHILHTVAIPGVGKFIKFLAKKSLIPNNINENKTEKNSKAGE